MDNKYEINVPIVLSIFTIGIWIIFEYRIFYIFPYTKDFYEKISALDGDIIAIILTFFITIIFFNKKLYVSKWFIRYILVMFLMIVSSITYTIIEYPQQSLWITIREGFRFLTPITSLVFFYYLLKRNLDKLFFIFNTAALLWSSIILIQSFLFSQSFGNFILGMESANAGFRNESFRLGLGVLDPLVLIYNFYSLYIKKEENKGFQLISFVLIFLALFLVDQTRAKLIVCILCILYLLLKKHNPFTKKIFLYFVVGMVIIICVQLGVFSSFINTFSTSSDDYYSTFARAYAVEYYFSQFVNSPFFGIGLLPEGLKTSDIYGYIVHGPTMMAYFSDVGIVGLLGNIGLWAIPVYIIPLCHWWKIIKNLNGKYKRQDIVFMKTLFLYMVLTSVTLINTLAVGMIVFSFCFGVFEYFNYRKDLQYKCNKEIT